MVITISLGVATVLVIFYSVQTKAQIEQTEEAMRCVEQDDALNLLSSCGASYDESLCSNNTGEFIFALLDVMYM